MEEEPPRKKVRKGTKSCLECRRRKVRCTWQSEYDSTCDGCLARRLSCRSQASALQHDHSDNELTTAPSRDRVSRLERKLEQLTDRFRFLDRGSIQDSFAQHEGDQNSKSHHGASAFATISVPPDDAVDLPGGDLTHMRTLIESAFVEADNSPSPTSCSSPPPSGGIAPEREALRGELVKLIPCERDVEMVLQHALDWWALVDTGVPSVSIGSKKELSAVLQRVREPQSDPALIALWLLTAAITVQQVPPDINRTVFKDPAMLRVFPENIMMSMETVLATHPEVMATVWGVECRLMLVKLQLNCGRVRKAWLTLRAGIACAELLGLPDICRSPEILSRLAQQDGVVNTTDPSSPVLKAGIWIQLCFLERFLGLLLNLPSTTRGRPSLIPRYLLRHNGADRELFWSLSNIAIRVRDRDDSVAFSETNTVWIAETEAIERALQHHADSASMCEQEPGIGGVKKFYEHSGALPLPLFHQHVYFYLLLRTHLPLMMQATRNMTPALYRHATHRPSTATGLSTDNEASCRASRSHDLCVYACTLMGRVYVQQFTGSLQGLFPIRICDFMAFTAVAILMLDQEGILRPATPPGLSASTVDRNTTGDAKLLEELVAMLKQAARQEGRVIAVQAVKAIESIRVTLATQGDARSPGTSIRIPLLGTMRVTRKTRSVAYGTFELIQDKHTSIVSPSGVNVGQSAEKIQHQATPMETYPGASDGLLQQRLDHGITASLPTVQSTMSIDSSSKVSGFFGPSDDQYDWVTEIMNTNSATSTQDALWMWDDQTFGGL